MIFTRSTGGTILVRQDDGSYRPVPSADRSAVAQLTDNEIDAMAASDPDHPALDDAFWSTVEARKQTHP